MHDESLDTLIDGGLRLWQSRSGYRFSLDALLLAHFVTVKPRQRIADLGAGSGVIALLLSYLHPTATLVGIEVQPSLAARARRSVALNGLTERIDIVAGDLRGIAAHLPAASCHVVVSNPPFRKVTSGRTSRGAERLLARHEIAGTLKDFLAAADYLLPAKGRLAMIYLAERAVELLAALRARGLEPKRLRWVHSSAGGPAQLLLVESVKGGKPGVTVLPPLIIYRQGKVYCAEVAAIVAGMAKPPGDS